MKKILLIVFLFAGFLYQSFGQAPQSFNYQAVARDASNQPYQNTNLGVRIRLLKDGTSGETEYSERHEVTTTDLGVFTLQIGEGDPISGDFSKIDWGSSTFYLHVAIDPEGGANYIPMGSSQLLSVPYALYANQAGGGDSDNDPANEIQTLVYDTATQQLTISGGNTISLNAPNGSGEAQTLSLSGTMLSIENGNTVDLSLIQDGVNDADADSTNELQSLSMSGSTLSISGGNSVSLPNTASHWTKVGENLFYDSGSVNISKNLTTEGIFRLFPDSSQTPLAIIQQGGEGAGEIITRGPNGSINTQITSVQNYSNLGAIGVFNGNGNLRAGLSVDSIGRGIVTTNILDAKSALFDAPKIVDPIVANVDGDTKFQVHTNGGVSIGSSATPPANGLAVDGALQVNSLETESAVFDAPENADPIWANVGADTKFRVHANGGISVGSGTIPPPNSIFVLGGQISLNYDYIRVEVPREIGFSGSLLPLSDNSHDLGKSAYRWDNVYASNGTIQTSDLREKKNVQTLNYGLKELMQLRAVRYEWKNKPYSDPKLGLIAQEILPHIPEVVQTHEWEYGEDENAEPERVELDRMGVYYSDLIPVLIKAIQEQQQQIEAQDQMLRELQQQVEQLGQKFVVQKEKK